MLERENVMTFLNRHGINSKSLNLTSHDWPQYTEEEPEIYGQEMLAKFFAAFAVRVLPDERDARAGSHLRDRQEPH